MALLFFALVLLAFKLGYYPSQCSYIGVWNVSIVIEKLMRSGGDVPAARLTP